MILFLIAVLVLLLYLFMIAPDLDRERLQRMKPFEAVYIAHRGLFDNKDIPENSLPAFRKAVKNGFGVELDVQRTADGKLVVFHDADMKRMCGVDRRPTDCSFEELQHYSLLSTDEKIPLFEDVLAVLKEDTPLIIEIKPEGDAVGTCRDTVEMMKAQKKTFIMESFHPMVVRYLKKEHPKIIRGQLAYDALSDPDNKQSFILKFCLGNLLENFLTRPDFTAYDIRAMHKLSFRIISKVFRGECVAWTVKSEKDLAAAKKYYQQFIFDSFIPSGEGENHETEQ